MRIQKNMILALSLILAISSCKKEIEYSSDAEILSYSIEDQAANLIVNNNTKSIHITFPDEVDTADDLIATFTISEGAMAFILPQFGDPIPQHSGISQNSFESPFIFKIEAEDGISYTNYYITTSNNSYTEDWGLGGFQKPISANNREYDWYYDQSLTGTYSSVNCGPTSTTMAAKWSFQAFEPLPEDARAAYRPEGGWWFTSDINSYLTDNNIPHNTISLSSNASGTGSAISNQIDAGNIVILCLDMYYISNGIGDMRHVDKFYSTSATGWGHFIVVKGYRIVDGELFFEVYDPYCFNIKYSDGSLKGIDRYYRLSDIYMATSIWWNYAIVISEKGSKSTIPNSIDPELIPHMWGR